MEFKSSAFKHNETIPARYTCDGEDISPPLQISGAPEGIKSFALICDDPDAPMGTWVHWVMWNMQPNTTEISENSVPKEAMQGMNSFGKLPYGGPCPPSGVHRYFFKLYALDALLELPAGSNKDELEHAMRHHILVRAELVGLYTRS